MSNDEYSRKEADRPLTFGEARTKLFEAIANCSSLDVENILKLAPGGDPQVDDAFRRALLSSKNEHGATPLQFAAALPMGFQSSSIVCLLLENGADAKALSKDARTASEIAADAGNASIVTTIATHLAKMDKADRDHRTASKPGPLKS